MYDDNIHYMSNDGKLEKVIKLLENGVDIESKNGCQYTPLHIAS